jgi:uncharacterized membrane protein YjjB (DUF3815 family)
MALVSTIAFSCLFNIPHNQLLFIGLAATVGWIIYQVANVVGLTATLGTFLATVVVTWILRIMTFYRKVPMTVFLLGGIIPLVPGAGIYRTLYAFISDDFHHAVQLGIDTVRLFGVMCIGIILVLSLPAKLFYFGRLIKKKGCVKHE